MAGDNGALRIGFSQTSAFFQGIRGATTGHADAVPVMVASNGQLGAVPSSIRLQEDGQDMAGLSSNLMRRAR